MTVTETDLRQWAGTVEAWSTMPVLLRRLVHETTPSLTHLHFPGYEATALPGVDGETTAGAASLWVPEGRTVWEIGCNDRIGRKATADYDKRVAEISPEVRAATIYTFVTPRTWPGRDAWLAERQARGDWKDVRALDAVDLVTWLEAAPVTRRWLAEKLGRLHPMLLTPDEWYRVWSSASTPAIPMDLVAGRRGDPGQALTRKLREGERTIPVVADSRQEAVAFVIAALTRAGADDLLDRMLVVTGNDGLMAAGTGPKPILVLDLPNDERIQLGDRHRFQIIRPMAKGQTVTHEGLELPHVAAETFRASLQGAGLSEDDARRHGYEAGHSVTVLRRRLAEDPILRRPAWAEDREAVRRMLPHAFAGGWLEGERHHDLKRLAQIGDVPESEILEGRAILARGEDAPLVRIGNVTIAVSQIDALFAIGPYLEKEDLDRFLRVAGAALGERDPALDLPEDERWSAAIHDKHHPCSGALLSGIGDALCILGVHGNAICGDRLGIDVPLRVAVLVRGLLSDMTPDRWLSLRNHLRRLAEAAPDAFLGCLEADLNRPEPTVTAIMGTVEGVITGDCLRTDLLWGLEALAWSPRYFARVAEIVVRLRMHEPDDNWSNRPSATALALFRDWLPGTVVGVDDRMDVLRRLAPRHRASAIDVCSSLIELGSRTASRTAMPRWRPLEGDPETVTNVERWNARRAASTLLLDLAPFDGEELRRVIEFYDGLHPDDLTRLRQEVERWGQEADDEAKAPIRDVIRRDRGWARRQHDGEDGAEALEERLRVLDEMEAHLEPTDPRVRHRWLFADHYVAWPELDEDELEDGIDHRRRAELVQGRRREALAEIEMAHGRDGVWEFAIGLEKPEIAAQALGGPGIFSEEVQEWAERTLTCSDTSNAAERFLSGVLGRNDEEQLEGIAGDLHRGGHLADPEAQRRFGRGLPNVEAGWRLADRMGGEVREAYWAHAHPRVFQDIGPDEADHVARSLLEAGRPRSAYGAGHFAEEKLSSKTWLAILRGIASGVEQDGPMPGRWYLDRIFARLDEDPEITEAEIAAAELPFAPALRRYGERTKDRTLAVHRVIAQDPAEFVSLLRWLYKRKDRQAEPELHTLDEKQREIRARIAYDVLDDWDCIAGMDAEGRIDRAAFEAWHEAAFRIAEEHDRLLPAYVHIGAALARLTKDLGLENWLPEVVLDLLDRTDMAELRHHFEIGVYNARGVTVRSAHDGGDQERALARSYRALATRLGNSHPRVASSLENIARGYEGDAKRLDGQAELGERWHP